MIKKDDKIIIEQNIAEAPPKDMHDSQKHVEELPLYFGTSGVPKQVSNWQIAMCGNKQILATIAQTTTKQATNNLTWIDSSQSNKQAPHIDR